MPTWSAWATRRSTSRSACWILISEPEVQLPVDIPRMADSVTTMVQRALESFLDGKAEVAEAVLQMDNIVDRMKDEAFVVLVQKMTAIPTPRGAA